MKRVNLFLFALFLGMISISAAQATMICQQNKCSNFGYVNQAGSCPEGSVGEIKCPFDLTKSKCLPAVTTPMFKAAVAVVKHFYPDKKNITVDTYTNLSSPYSMWQRCTREISDVFAREFKAWNFDCSEGACNGVCSAGVKKVKDIAEWAQNKLLNP